MTDAGFPGQVRLRQPPEFKRVFAKGRRQHDEYFTLVVLNNSLNHPRIGLTVSRRAARFAVQRNRIKRVIRESFRQQQAHLPALDIVIMAKPAVVQADNRQLRDSLVRHWQRLA